MGVVYLRFAPRLSSGEPYEASTSRNDLEQSLLEPPNRGGLDELSEGSRQNSSRSLSSRPVPPRKLTHQTSRSLVV